MADFVIDGPYAIPYEWKPGGRTMDYNGFWDESDELKALQWERGCYVFSVRAGKGVTPLYVGKATRTFRQECFNAGNRNKLANGLSDYSKGSPIIYFVRHPKQRGKTNAKQISEIENFLIQNAVLRNPDLQNIHGRDRPKWSIRGVIRSGKRRPTNAESQFKRLLGLNK